MAKISHHFRLDDIRAKELEKLAEHLTVQQALTGFPKKITKTDVIEYLISTRFTELKLEGFDL